MEEKLIAKWKNLGLSKEEMVAIRGAGGDRLHRKQQPVFRLVGSMINDSCFNLSSLGRTMIEAWKPSEDVKFRLLKENVVLFEFSSKRDKDRVLKECPWSFDNQLFILQEYDGITRPSDLIFTHLIFWLRVIDLPLIFMNKITAEKIGSAIGSFIEADVDEEGNANGLCLRIKISLDIRKPLRRGILLSIEENDEPQWYSIKYERMPNFCYCCGRLGHLYYGCESYDQDMDVEDFKYGKWLLASSPVACPFDDKFKMLKRGAVIKKNTQLEPEDRETVPMDTNDAAVVAEIHGNVPVKTEVQEVDCASRNREGRKEMEENQGGKEDVVSSIHVVETSVTSLCTIIKVARDEDLKEQIGKDRYFDLVDHDKVRIFRVLKQTPFKVFKEHVAKEFGIPVKFQRFWKWAKRQNHTYRPFRPLTPQEESQAVGQIREVSNTAPKKKKREVSNNANSEELNLFLEIWLGPDRRPITPPVKTKKDILLFFKLYDPQKIELRYVGKLYVKSYGNPIEILDKLNQMAGFAPDEEIELFEEIKFDPFVMCERLDKRTSFQSSQIENGDIICFHKYPVESEEEHQYPDVPSFLEYVRNHQNRICSRSQ